MYLKVIKDKIDINCYLKLFSQAKNYIALQGTNNHSKAGLKTHNSTNVLEVFLPPQQTQVKSGRASSQPGCNTVEIDAAITANCFQKFTCICCTAKTKIPLIHAFVCYHMNVFYILHFFPLFKCLF